MAEFDSKLAFQLSKRHDVVLSKMFAAALAAHLTSPIPKYGAMHLSGRQTQL
jgi:hypothetical protein